MARAPPAGGGRGRRGCRHRGLCDPAATETHRGSVRSELVARLPVARRPQPRLLRGPSPKDRTELPLRCPRAACKRGGGPGRATLATREPAAQHKAAVAQVSAAAPRESPNVPGPSHPTPLSHRLPPPGLASGFSHLHPKPGAGGEEVGRARKRGERLGPAPLVPRSRASSPHCPHPQARTTPRPQPPDPHRPSPQAPLPPPPLSLSSALDHPASPAPRPRPPGVPRPRWPRYSPPTPVAAARGAGAGLGVAVLLQGCRREGVEKAGAQRRPAEAAARPGQKESQLHLARLPAGTAAPGERTAGAHQRRDRTPCPRRRTAREPASGARVRAESVWGAPTPLRGRLLKFSEVGSTPSKGAWGFLINPRWPGAQEAAVAAELGLELRWESQKPKSPENYTVRQGPPTHTLQPSQPNPLRVRKRLWSTPTPRLAAPPGKVV